MRKGANFTYPLRKSERLPRHRCTSVAFPRRNQSTHGAGLTRIVCCWLQASLSAQQRASWAAACHRCDLLQQLHSTCGSVQRHHLGALATGIYKQRCVCIRSLCASSFPLSAVCTCQHEQRVRSRCRACFSCASCAPHGDGILHRQQSHSHKPQLSHRHAAQHAAPDSLLMHHHSAPRHTDLELSRCQHALASISKHGQRGFLTSSKRAPCTCTTDAPPTCTASLVACTRALLKDQPTS